MSGQEREGLGRGAGAAACAMAFPCGLACWLAPVPGAGATQLVKKGDGLAEELGHESPAHERGAGGGARECCCCCCFLFLFFRLPTAG